MSIARRAFLATLALLALRPSFGAEQPIPLSSFFDSPRLSSAELSPDGKHLAMRFMHDNNHGHDQLGIVTLADNSVKIVAGFADADVARFEWVNDNRLVYTTSDKDTPPGLQQHGAGLFAVNIDGSTPRQLVELAHEIVGEAKLLSREMLPPNTYLLSTTDVRDSNAVYVVKVDFGNDHSPRTVYLLKLDTVSGRSESVRGPEGHTREWLLDAQGRPALASTIDENRKTFHYRDPATGAWRKLATQDAFLGADGGFAPLGFAPDGTLYVESRQGRNTNALFSYDLAAGKVSPEPLIDTAGYDFRGHLVIGNGKLLGVRYVSDGAGTVWFDSTMKQVQQQVDKLLPDTINMLSIGAHSETPFVLVTSWSDRPPNQHCLLHPDTRARPPLARSHPAIEPARMAPLDLIRVKARDGLSIPTWITIPPSVKGTKAPMVVLVHGGPYVRGGDWRWNPQAQFLASRGYVVIEPEYRGSTGYGAAHFRAGWKQWGLAMQDDIADVTRWAIAEGIADPGRICIAGASYGGYATLMGLIRYPDLYKCGIDWVGVTDIDLLFNGHWSAMDDMSDAYKKYGMPTLIGDQVKDAAQFAATSPLKQAARVTQPLLLAYGGADKRVPIYHGRKFYNAVKETNQNVEWVVYQDEGHGWTLRATRLDFWGRVEKFLDARIGAGVH